MSKRPWRVSQRRLDSLDAECAALRDEQQAVHDSPGQMTRADWTEISALTGQLIRLTDDRDRLAGALWRSRRAKDRRRAEVSD